MIKLTPEDVDQFRDKVEQIDEAIESRLKFIVAACDTEEVSEVATAIVEVLQHKNIATSIMALASVFDLTCNLGEREGLSLRPILLGVFAKLVIGMGETEPAKALREGRNPLSH